MLRSFLSKKRHFFKTTRPSKAKIKTALAKTKTSKNGVGLKDYITSYILMHYCKWRFQMQELGTYSYLYVKLPRPGDCKGTFKILKSRFPN